MYQKSKSISRIALVSAMIVMASAVVPVSAVQAGQNNTRGVDTVAEKRGDQMPDGFIRNVLRTQTACFWYGRLSGAYTVWIGGECVRLDD